MKEFFVKNIDSVPSVCRRNGEAVEVIGKVSEKARKWISEGDEYDNDEMVAQPAAMSIRKPIKAWNPEQLVDVTILFKCPECGNFR